MNYLRNIYRYKVHQCLPKPIKSIATTSQLRNSRCCSNKSAKDESSSKKLGDIAGKYKPFAEDDNELILDVYEEKLKYSSGLLEEAALEENEEFDAFEGLNLQRGQSGVYELDDLLDVLKRENAVDIFVVQVPVEHNYVDYIVIVTGKSKRHMQAIAQFVRRVYKQKRHETDDLPKVEGENSSDWMAMDLGNIALHIFSNDARVYYDLESLWALGPEFDKEFNKKDEIVEILEKHSIYLKDLQSTAS